MIDIRIVCTHDAVGLAEALMRLLAAEQHRVMLTYGRHSLRELEAAQSSREAIVLIWSNDAPSQHYMLEWLHGIDPSRLVEVARAPGAPRLERRAALIDFTNWRGDRGSRPWTALNERLRAVARAMEPPKAPPNRAALALGVASLAAVTSAIFVRADQDVAGAAPEPIESIIASTDTPEAVGGPLTAVEPASADEPIEVRPLGARLPRMELTTSELPPPGEVVETELRSPTLFERISDIGLLLDRG